MLSKKKRLWVKGIRVVLRLLTQELSGALEEQRVRTWAANMRSSFAKGKHLNARFVKRKLLIFCNFPCCTKIWHWVPLF